MKNICLHVLTDLNEGMYVKIWCRNDVHSRKAALSWAGVASDKVVANIYNNTNKV